ncbi:MAG: hypothetical protein V2A58_08635 [Planctomycetota bacterium]
MRRTAVTILVTLFWLAMMGLLVYREVLPGWLEGGAPSYRGLLENLSAPAQETMGVYRSGRRVGSASARRRPRQDGGFELTSDLRIDEPVPLLGQPSKLRLTMTVLLDPRKELESVEVLMEAIIRLHLLGKVDRNAILFHSVDGLMLPPLAVPWSGRELFQHSLLPLTGVRNLRVGKRWRVRLMGGLASDVGTANVEVKAFEPVVLHGKVVQAFRIEERLGDEGPAYRAWVAPDGTLLMQELPLGLTLMTEDTTGD